jgi:hypothetical protein
VSNASPSTLTTQVLLTVTSTLGKQRKVGWYWHFSLQCSSAGVGTGQYWWVLVGTGGYVVVCPNGGQPACGCGSGRGQLGIATLPWYLAGTQLVHS